jgi:hypothetical protein
VSMASARRGDDRDQDRGRTPSCSTSRPGADRAARLPSPIENPSAPDHRLVARTAGTSSRGLCTGYWGAPPIRRLELAQRQRPSASASTGCREVRPVTGWRPSISTGCAERRWCLRGQHTPGGPPAPPTARRSTIGSCGKPTGARSRQVGARDGRQAGRADRRSAPTSRLRADLRCRARFGRRACRRPAIRTGWRSIGSARAATSSRFGQLAGGRHHRAPHTLPWDGALSAPPHRRTELLRRHLRLHLGGRLTCSTPGPQHDPALRRRPHSRRRHEPRSVDRDAAAATGMGARRRMSAMRALMGELTLIRCAPHPVRTARLQWLPRLEATPRPRESAGPGERRHGRSVAPSPWRVGEGIEVRGGPGSASNDSSRFEPAVQPAFASQQPAR